MVASALINAWGASKASNAQKDAAQRAADIQLQMYNTTRGDLMPYNTGGQQDFTAMNRLLTGSPSQVQASMEAMPGYQFALSQGLKSVQNSATARGLGVSGAALKGAASYATGLADQTYGNQVNRLLAGAQLGENAAAQTGVAATATGQGVGGSYIDAGNAKAAGYAGIANAASGFFNNANRAGMMMFNMYGG